MLIKFNYFQQSCQKTKSEKTGTTGVMGGQVAEEKNKVYISVIGKARIEPEGMKKDVLRKDSVGEKVSPLYMGNI